MDHPPHSFHICPCCGTEFELDDDEVSHEELRALWVNLGCLWFSRATSAPNNWNPQEQLKRFDKE